MTSNRKWAILRSVVLTRKPHKKQAKLTSKIQEEERRRGVTITACGSDKLLSALREEQQIYAEKVHKIKQTVDLTRILKRVAKQEKRKNKVADDMKASENLNVRTIKESHLPTDNHLSVRCKERGDAQLQVRQKRADLGRVVAKKTATIQNLHTKLDIITNDKMNDGKGNATKKQLLKLPTLELIANKKPLHRKDPHEGSEKHRQKKTIHIQGGKSAYSVLLNLIKRMEGYLDTLDKSTAVNLKDNADVVKKELKIIEDSIMHELKSIKSKQELEARVQKMRVKYKELVQKYYEREFWTTTAEQRQAELDKLNEERKRLRKIRYEQLQAKLRRMKIEKDMFGYMTNSRFTQRSFSYFR